MIIQFVGRSNYKCQWRRTVYCGFESALSIPSNHSSNASSNHRRLSWNATTVTNRPTRQSPEITRRTRYQSTQINPLSIHNSNDDEDDQVSRSSEDRHKDMVQYHSLQPSKGEKSDEEEGGCSLVSVEEYLRTKELPPPLPEPKYSFYKRVLPESLIALNSKRGRELFLEVPEGSMETYFALSEHFMNQSDPAYCGVTTLAMMLNVCRMDPAHVRWSGGWRYFHNEQSVLSTCHCYLNHPHYISRAGITMNEFQTLASCHNLQLTIHYASSTTTQPTTPTDHPSNQTEEHLFSSLEEFRNHVQEAFGSTSSSTVEDDEMVPNKTFVVVSFARQKLDQTGDGHFSPLAAYHESTDQVLILDVARFKYAPYWVSLDALYHSMTELDSVTQLPRGWFLIHHPSTKSSFHGGPILAPTNHDGRKMAQNLPLMKHVQIKNQQTILQKINNHPTKIPFCQHHK